MWLQARGHLGKIGKTSEFKKQNVRAGEVAGGKPQLLSTQETLGVPNAQTQTTEVGSL